MNDKKISPLEILVAAHNDTPSVKVVPRNRLQEETSVIPIIESMPIDIGDMGEGQPIVFANSNFTLNFHMNIDNTAVEKVMQKSAEVAKNIAAMGAAFLGTAILFGQSKKFGKVKIPLSPRTKFPKI